MVRERGVACSTLDKGLTAVYNAMDEGAFAGLRTAHEDLDRAVMACYGLEVGLLNDRPALLAALFDLNAAAAADLSYAPFATGSV